MKKDDLFTREFLVRTATEMRDEATNEFLTAAAARDDIAFDAAMQKGAAARAALSQQRDKVLADLEAARMDAAKELFEAMAIGAPPDLLDAIEKKHKPVFEALLKIRGTTLPKDIADLILPRSK